VPVLADIVEPTGRNTVDDQAERLGPDASDVGPAGERQGRRRSPGGWVLLGLGAVVSAAVLWVLSSMAVSLLPLGDWSVAGYLTLLLAAAATGLATGFAAGLRGWAAAVPMLGAAALASVTYGATGGAIDPFLASVAAGSAGALLGVVVADRRGGSPTPVPQHPDVPSRSRAFAWTLAALAVPVLVVLAVYVNYLMDLLWFGVAAGALAIPATLGTGACVAQARRHSGREPRWGLSMFLGAVAAMIALYASYILVATVYYAQF
jgi:hypothetical protein